MKCENWAVLGYVEVASLEPARLLDKMVIEGKKQGRNCHLDQILTGAVWDYVGDVWRWKEEGRRWNGRVIEVPLAG